jgi:hypothetical protein
LFDEGEIAGILTVKFQAEFRNKQGLSKRGAAPLKCLLPRLKRLSLLKRNVQEREPEGEDEWIIWP